MDLLEHLREDLDVKPGDEEVVRHERHVQRVEGPVAAQEPGEEELLRGVGPPEDLLGTQDEVEEVEEVLLEPEVARLSGEVQKLRSDIEPVSEEADEGGAS